ncbi:hypothetical protein GCM10009038_22680 [Salinicola rhizosphaerae]|uniref:Copper resistance protein NlpE n=1 Tax=Salinicola rhizosphaerae TaxID=1443141 RepID=A0ABQ3E277_9GAMM|nr:hypothetical protein GCM10009038_22680 [Salinicola rhizosphaerae]
MSACASGPPTEVNYVRATERFEGTLPCTDCQGIDTDLIIKRDAITGAPAGFYLHEVRIDAPGGERVNTSWGNWSQNLDVTDFKRQLYVLRPEVGNARVFVPLESGDLQPLSADGAPLVDDEGADVELERLTPSLSETATRDEKQTDQERDG